MYTLYVDGGGQTIKERVYPTYFSYKCFKNSCPVEELQLNKLFLRNLIPKKYYIPRKMLLEDGQILYITPNDSLMIPKGCSIRDDKGRETNNIAEYAALYYALSHFLSIKGTAKVTVYQDSQLVVNQVLGKYKVNKHLEPWCNAVQTLMWNNVILNHIKREVIVEILGH